MMGRRCCSALSLFVVGWLVFGCEENAFDPPPPASVMFMLAEQRDVTEYAAFTGTTESSVAVDVRARVSGIIEEVRFEAGERVEAGASLFLIDPEPFIVTRDALRAEVESARAQRRLAETSAERIERSARDGALSELQALEARSRADVAAAAVAVAEKQLAIKQLDVDYTEVVSPVAGRVEESAFDVGDLVGAGLGDGLLTRVYDDSAIDVHFSVPDRVYLRAMRRAEPGRAVTMVEVGSEVDDGFPFVGTIEYADPVVDEATGTVRVRARIDNSDGRLVGGLFVRVRLVVGTLEGALVVPESAIGSDQVGSYVMVVGAGDVVERREVELGPRDGTGRVILSGIDQWDRVIVRGLLRARPGSTVAPEPVDG